MLISLFNYVLLSFLVLYRAAGNLWVGHYPKIFSAYIFFILFVYILLKINDFKIKSFFLFYSSFTLLTYGIIISFFNDVVYLRSLIPHLYSIFFLILLILILSKFRVTNIFKIFNYFKYFSKYIFISFSSCIIANNLLGFYPGFSCFPLVIPLIFSIIYKHYFLLTTILSLTLFSGKRSVFLTFILIFLFSNYIKKKSILNVCFISFIIFTCFILIYVVNLDLSILNKFMLLFKIVDLEDSLYLASSGRSAEVFGSLSLFEENFKYLWGVGYGFNFNYLDRDGSEILSHYVHFTPLNYVLNYGIILTILIYIFKFYIIFTSIRLFRRFPENVFLFLILFSVALILYSLFTYNVINDIFYYLVLLILFKINHNFKYYKILKLS